MVNTRGSTTPSSAGTPVMASPPKYAFTPRSGLSEITNSPEPKASPAKPAAVATPPPPPAVEEVKEVKEVGAASAPFEKYASLLALLRFEHTASTTAFGAGQLAFTMYFFDISFLYYASWLLLGSLLYNAAASTFGASSPPLGRFTSEDIERFVPVIVDGLNLALRTYERVFKCGEPRLTLAAAAAAYAVALLSSYASCLTLAWLAFCGAFVVPAVRHHGAYELAKKTLTMKLAELASPEAQAALLAKAPPAAKEHLDAAKGYFATVKADHLKFLGGSAALMVWLCSFGFFSKMLSAGFGLLAYKAWASDSEVAAQVDVACAKMGELKQRARRMTMGAQEMLGLGKFKEQ